MSALSEPMDKRTFLKTTGALFGTALLAPFACRPPAPARTNWAGNIQYSTDRLYTPASVEELQEVVAANDKIRALGSRHCFNTIADSAAVQVTLERLNQVIALEEGSVTVGAGMRYGELCPYLHERGYALHNLASLPHISIAGAAATATHGSGRANGNLATVVQAFEMIKADGSRVQLARTTHGEEFAAAVVHLGALGVVTHLTLATEPAYDMVQHVYLGLPVADMDTHFDAIMGLGHSVSIFTDWRTDELSQVWVKQRAGIEDIVPEPVLFGAALADRNVHPVLALSAESCTGQMGVRGPWYERLPHFKMAFTPSSGEELQSEFFVDAQHAPEVIDVLRSMGDVLAPLLMISEVRTIAADDLWLSTAYGRDSVAFHFTWYQDWDLLMQILPHVEAALAPFGARPHWGKNFLTTRSELDEHYEMLPAFRDLARESDPEGKFRNAFIEQYL